MGILVPLNQQTRGNFAFFKKKESLCPHEILFFNNQDDGMLLHTFPDILTSFQALWSPDKHYDCSN